LRWPPLRRFARTSGKAVVVLAVDLLAALSEIPFQLPEAGRLLNLRSQMSGGVFISRILHQSMLPTRYEFGGGD
jgi:hypothetical protein